MSWQVLEERERHLHNTVRDKEVEIHSMNEEFQQSYEQLDVGIVERELTERAPRSTLRDLDTLLILGVARGKVAECVCVWLCRADAAESEADGGGVRAEPQGPLAHGVLRLPNKCKFVFILRTRTARGS